MSFLFPQILLLSQSAHENLQLARQAKLYGDFYILQKGTQVLTAYDRDLKNGNSGSLHPFIKDTRLHPPIVSSGIWFAYNFASLVD